MRKKFIYKDILLFTVLYGIVFLVLYSVFVKKQENCFQEKINDLDMAYGAIINTHRQVSTVIFNEIVNQPDVLAILKIAQSDDEKVRDRARQQLFNKLNPVYQRLKKLNIRQFHFHLPDNTSFLRFHKPSRYGDDLTDIRYSIKTVNARLRPLWGFEEGRIKNGFRYVFPVIDNGQHLGSVEISMSFIAVNQDLKVIFGKKYHLLIDKNTVENKVFDSERAYYVVSDLNDDYFIELSCIKQKEEHVAHKLIRDKIRDKMAQKIAFSEETVFKGEYYIFTFLPIINVEGKKVAYLVSSEVDQTIKEFRFEYRLSLFVGFIVVLAFVILLDRLQESYETIKYQSIIDVLTGLPNRRFLEDKIRIEFKLSKRYKKGLAVVICDIDHFKFLNETYGHACGDKCLRKVAQTLKETVLRPADFCARYGGEEFIVLLPDTDIDGAFHVAELIREAVEKLQIPNEKSSPLPVVTLSFGVAGLKECGAASSDELIKCADLALYQAKAGGRNKVVVYDSCSCHES
jgi:diguanylate cyclase (GGDEF)-like protein